MARASMLMLFALLFVAPCRFAAGAQMTLGAGANPIRKVVNLLQSMKAKVEEEGKAEEKLYEKFQCYCKKSGGELKDSIASAEAKIPQLEAEISAASQRKSQLKADVKAAKEERDSAKSSVAEAASMRKRAAESFATEKAKTESYIAAMKQAIQALENGMGGSFLQSPVAGVVRQLASGSPVFTAEDKRELLAFFSRSTSSDYAPSTGEVVGMLKQMLESFSEALAKSIDDEESSIKGFKAIVAAKKREIAALTAIIEDKTQRAGEVAVSIVQTSGSLSDAKKGLAEDKKLLSQLDKGCATASSEWEEQSKTRAEEVVALADTIKVLNDDDALDLFKKTLPSPGAASFLQIMDSTADRRSRAYDIVRKAREAKPGNHFRLDFVALAIKGKKFGFEKVSKVIDSMTKTLKKEQSDDEAKKEFCKAEIDATEDQAKTLQVSISDSETAIAHAKEGIATASEDIAALELGITELDANVATAMKQRKEEHAAYAKLMAEDGAAKELLEFAKNRLNKFYNQQLYKAPPKRELSDGDQIYSNFGGDIPTEAPGGIANTGITVFMQDGDAPEGATYKKKSEESSGVIAMMNLLISDLDKQMAEAETSEKDAQSDYEATMKDSTEKRAMDTESLTAKMSTKAELQAQLEAHKADKSATKKELFASAKYMSSLHQECDWLLSNFEARKAARSNEIDALTNAKAVLAGADYSFVQVTRHRVRLGA